MSGREFDSPEGSEQDLVVARKVINRFVDDMQAVPQGGTVRLFIGEANPDIFNDDELISECQRITYFHEARLRIITSPAILIDNKDFNGILYLLEDKDLESLQFRQSRSHERHYYVIDNPEDPRYAIETYHPAGSSLASRQIITSEGKPLAERQQTTAQLISHFDRYSDRLRVKPGNALIPLRTTSRGLNLLVNGANGKYDHMSGQQLLELAAKLRSPIPYWKTADIPYCTGKYEAELDNSDKTPEHDQQTIPALKVSLISRSSEWGVERVKYQLPNLNIKLPPAVECRCGGVQLLQSGTEFTFHGITGVGTRIIDFPECPVYECPHCLTKSVPQQVGELVQRVVFEETKEYNTP